MNTQMAYVLGMIVGNGEIQRGANETTIVIEIPHKKLETEFQKDVGIYVKASITDIRQIVEPLVGTGLKFSQSANVSDLSFTKPNEDYLIREIMRYIGNASTHENMRISHEVYHFTTDERKQFIRGFSDVTGYIRRSNYFFKEPQYRVYVEIPQNWELVIDFCNLLKSVDIPVQNIDWGHPNMRDGNLKKYNQGKPDFWKKEHQVKIWALEFEGIGFGVLHKQEALDYFAHEHQVYIEKQGKKPEDVLHKYYWELSRKRKEKPTHPCESDPFIPEKIRGKHYDSWQDIADDLGYNKDSEC